MLLPLERDCHTLQRLPPPFLTDDRAGGGFIILTAKPALRPERRRDRVRIAIRHFVAIDASQHRLAIAQPKARLPYVIDVVQTGASDPIDARYSQLTVGPASGERSPRRPGEVLQRTVAYLGLSVIGCRP